MKNKKKDPLEGTIVESVPEFDLEASEKALEAIIAADKWTPAPAETKSSARWFLGDYKVTEDNGLTTIAWASEEGIRSAVIPTWVVEKLRV